MKGAILFSVIFWSITVSSTFAYGQNSISVSVPAIWSDVKVKDNWTPPTAINYKEYLTGTALGYGIGLNYSFCPKLIFKNRAQHFAINVGLGYFNQKFYISRPFDYLSPVQIIYRTDSYSYQCWYWTAGLTYNYLINAKYSFTANLLYSQLRSFQQEYIPTSGDPPQVNKFNINFAKVIALSFGVKRNLGQKLAVGINLLLPYTLWHNDKIFKDDPSTFSHPSFSLGSSISITYHFKKNITKIL